MQKTTLTKSIDNTKNTIKNTKNAIKKLNSEVAKLSKKPYEDVASKVINIEAEISILKVNLEKLEKTLLQDQDILSKSIYLSDKEAEVVLCVVEQSACIRFSAEISTTVLFDITNDINFTHNKTNIEQILDQEGFSDYESKTSFNKRECIKIGDKYFVECE